jgi:hypothetical protein
MDALDQPLHDHKPPLHLEKENLQPEEVNHALDE